MYKYETLGERRLISRAVWIGRRSSDWTGGCVLAFGNERTASGPSPSLQIWMQERRRRRTPLKEPAKSSSSDEMRYGERGTGGEMRYTNDGMRYSGPCKGAQSWPPSCLLLAITNRSRVRICIYIHCLYYFRQRLAFAIFSFFFSFLLLLSNFPKVW